MTLSKRHFCYSVYNSECVFFSFTKLCMCAYVYSDGSNFTVDAGNIFYDKMVQNTQKNQIKSWKVYN